MTIYYTNNIFKELIEKYPSWDELHKYLESDEGGLFRIVDTNGNFCLVRYEKGLTNMNLPHSKWFRSVVWNTENNKPVCIAPPKASSIDDFKFNTIQNANRESLVCQEFIEGFMINCFRIIGDDTLYITSRSKLDATGKFYSDKTFRELFIEAYQEMHKDSENNIFNDSVDQKKSYINIYPDSSKDEVAVFYSFLVQHKEHRIVKKINENRVYQIQSGIIYNDGRVEIEDTPDTYLGKPNMEDITIKEKTVIKTYAQIASDTSQENMLESENENSSELSKWIKNYINEKDWQFQGLVFKDQYGNRWRFRSDKYALVKGLRGNSSNIFDRFSYLYCQNLLQRYLEYYSDETMDITIQLMFMNNIIKTVYDNYVELHITKTKKADEINKIFLPHLYNIHGLYLSKLRHEGKKVNIEEITYYFHKQPWQRISFLFKKLLQEYNHD